MINNNDEVLNIVFKISDKIEYEVNKDGIVTILEKQDYRIQRFFRKLKFKI
ncbi:MAG TPA: PqqD family peptide modification chaperone, partial [Romboutsia sp.]|nr:PqqD family peptide modification chaperone [Romboutsia sp.]